MKEVIATASRVVNTHIALVLLVAIGNVQISTGASGIMTYISFVASIISFIVEIVVYGWIVAQIRGQDSLPAFREVIKNNWTNYAVVSILLAVPLLILKQVQGSLLIIPENALLVREVLSNLIIMTTIYVLPFVFLKQEHVVAIQKGTSYLLRNLRRSFPSLLLGVCFFIVKISTVFGFIEAYRHTGSLFILAPIILVGTLFATYILFLMFSAATTVLVQEERILSGT